MTTEYKMSLTELNSILNYMNVELKKKVPQKFIDFINKNMDKNYIPNIDKNIPINQQKLKKDTKVLLSLIYRNYWCDFEKKKELIKEDLISKNEYEKNLQEKYSPNTIFKNKQAQNEETLAETHTKLIKYKEPKWYKKIFTKILKLFKNFML